MTHRLLSIPDIPTRSQNYTDGNAMCSKVWINVKKVFIRQFTNF